MRVYSVVVHVILTPGEEEDFDEGIYSNLQRAKEVAESSIAVRGCGNIVCATVIEFELDGVLLGRHHCSPDAKWRYSPVRESNLA